MCNVPQQAPVTKIPKDGVGPRGVPDCYYTSRVLNSTFRYAKFVKQLRIQEEEQRKGAENNLKALKDQQICDFFLSSDRKSLINNVARRVDLCLQSYQDDLNQKRKRLIQLFSYEEEANIRKFVEQTQAGTEAIWQQKQDRLKFLLAKRKKEHEEKYKDTPLSKCAHVLPCIYKMRAKECEEIQLYQMKEKEARREAEKEFDRMWHEVAMSECEALKARMEQDAIQRYRRDYECKKYTDYQLEQNRVRREKERERLMEESKRFKAIWDEDIRKEKEAEEERAQKRKEAGMERKAMIEERQQVLKKSEAEAKAINDAWDSLASQGLADELAKIELEKKKKRETNECNRKLIELRNEIVSQESANDDLFREEAAKMQKITDEKRCAYQSWAQKTNRDVRKAMIDQIKERQDARQALKEKLATQDKYDQQLFKQLEELNDLKNLTDAQRRKKHQNDLVAQIEYNKILKERAKQDEINELKKCQLATEQYQEEIQKMMCRPFFSDEVHPFLKQMAKGLKMREKCPCSKSDHCQQ